MYLKALEIQGFKSFPEKTRLTFDKPVTAIVGPNGSGKSNISDAVLWVTGEQSSKALRGGKMEDVIFGGTQKRGPMGFAEVSLIFDNSRRFFDMDNTEVMITRRYYRSGESEYYINRQSVRLRDVNELLMDTGMGHEGYSIIGQGKIDSILSAKSTDRREIFEEAAGISRFRHRKEEAERRLLRTDENLVRINDKIAELELQVQPLKKQSEVAKKYLVLRDELRGLEISVWLDRLEKLQLQLQQLENNCRDTADTLDRTNGELEELYRKSEAFSRQMQEKDVAADQLRGQLSQQESVRAGVDSELAVLQANLGNNRQQAERIRQELERQNSQNEGIGAQIRDRQERIGQIDGRMEQIETQILTLEEGMRAAAEETGKAAQALNELMAQKSRLDDQQGTYRQELSAFASAAQTLEDRGVAVRQEIAAAADKLSQYQAEETEKKKELEAARERLQEIQNKIRGYTIIAEGKRKKAELAKDKLTDLKVAYNSLVSRIGLLTEMEREYQGYSRAVKLVMQDASRGLLKNVHGTVAQMLKTSERYAVAVETALGGGMQNIIVSTEQDGKAAIAMLKRKDGGRATFLPLSTIRGTVLNSRDLEGEAGFEGIASELVTFDPQYTGIYQSLLGRTAIVETIDDAIRISRKNGARFRIVTLDGQVMNAGGSMTGGSASKNAGILSRANELEKLRQQETLTKEAIGEAQRAETESAREYTKARQELELETQDGNAADRERLQLENDVQHYGLFIRSAQEALESLRAEAGELEEKIEDSSRQIDDRKQRIARCQQEEEDLTRQIREQSAGQESLLARRDEINEQIAVLRAERASLEAEKTATLAAVDELAQLRTDLSMDLGTRLRLADELDESSLQICGQIEEKQRQLAEANRELTAIGERIAAITAEKLALEGERTRRDRQLQQVNNRVIELEREKSALEQKKIAMEAESGQLVDKLWDTYELSRTDAYAVRQELEDYQQARHRIGELKREISRLGNPNIGAIEEYERVNSRYTYLTEQRDDVENAKGELLEIITSVTSEMEQIFRREFDLINASFKQTFLELFGGGKADLELEDESDILGCGIEIRIQPPGKSLKTITLLSGGEKAFVAIALYFSILKVRPTPFVVMDEIEAALDEANVLKVAAYMRRMSEKTQMIVITHRRGTMEEADVLYGVTMQEKGVSKILNIDLDEAEKTIAK